MLTDFISEYRFSGTMDAGNISVNRIEKPMPLLKKRSLVNRIVDFIRQLKNFNKENVKWTTVFRRTRKSFAISFGRWQTHSGCMEAYEFKNYILGMIFYYYLSDRTEKYMANSERRWHQL